MTIFKVQYIGSDFPHLKDKTALAQRSENSDKGVILVQFDDLSVPESIGWHPMYSADFNVIS